MLLQVIHIKTKKQIEQFFSNEEKVFSEKNTQLNSQYFIKINTGATKMYLQKHRNIFPYSHQMAAMKYTQAV